MVPNSGDKYLLKAICYKVIDVINVTLNDISLYAPTSQNDQTNSKNSSSTADKLCECVWPFCGADADT